MGERQISNYMRKLECVKSKDKDVSLWLPREGSRLTHPPLQKDLSLASPVEAPGGQQVRVRLERWLPV